MKIGDLKYLSAFIIPLLVCLGVQKGSYFSYSAFLFAFVCVPALEPYISSSSSNLNNSEKQDKSNLAFFDVLLYLNIPIILFLLYILGVKVDEGVFSKFELTGQVISYGILLGSCGINVAHELGHKDKWYAKYSSILLLVPSLYSHFFIEHNRGHHKNVATREDPATARFGESLYYFWIRSVFGSYRNAWRLENNRLDTQNKSIIGLENQMMRFTIYQLAYLILLFCLFNLMTVMIILAIGVISFLFLEMINYVEHYGLIRSKLGSGRYERVQPWHSWNSNHQLGRIILYELTRHSDHHFLANKKYQCLDHHESSPQLPHGYPTSMLISLVPPLWFKTMDTRVVKYRGMSA